MGEYNSSITRVWPVFDALFYQDPTGNKWLPSLLSMGSMATQTQSHFGNNRNLGPILPHLARFEQVLPGPLAKALGPTRSARIGNIRKAYEAEIPPSAAFLRWLLENPGQLTWPTAGKSKDRVFGLDTQEKRKRLVSGDPAVRDEALDDLSMVGATGSRRKWWAFEGFTSVDCLLETESLLLLIEGKRTEPVSESTDWFPGRNQVIRNLEVAQALAAGRKDFAVLLCAETPIELPDDVWRKSLPHFTDDQIDNLKRHYLGCAIWSAIAQKLCDGMPLPDRLDEAVELCLGFRK